MTHLYQSTTVLVWVTNAVVKHHDQEQAEEERVPRLTLLPCGISLKEVKIGTQAEQELGGRSWCQGQGRVGTSYWLVPQALLRLLSYRTQDHQHPQWPGPSHISH